MQTSLMGRSRLALRLTCRQRPAEDLSDKENAGGGKTPRNTAAKLVHAMHAKSPFSVARGNENTPVELDVRQKRPTSAPDALALKRISLALQCADNSDDDLVS